MTQRGVVYIALGNRAEGAALASLVTLREHYDGPAEIWSDKIIRTPLARPRFVSIPYTDNVPGSRFCKVSLADVSPFKYTLYLDSDTLVRAPVDAGFDILADGFDLALSLSNNQGDTAMHHVSEEERWYTMCQLFGCPLQLQAGVMFVRKSEAASDLFWTWRNEWRIWHGQDQAALLRAIDKSPARVWLLGRPWNGGAIIEHRFGRARE